MLLIVPKQAFLKSLDEFPDIEAQVQKMMKLRQGKIEKKLDRILKQNERDPLRKLSKGPAPRILLKTSDYVWKVLLQIKDRSAKKRRSTVIIPKVKGKDTFKTPLSPKVPKKVSLELSAIKETKEGEDWRENSARSVHEEPAPISFMDKLKVLAKANKEADKKASNLAPKRQETITKQTPRKDNAKAPAPVYIFSMAKLNLYSRKAIGRSHPRY